MASKAFFTRGSVPMSTAPIWSAGPGLDEGRAERRDAGDEGLELVVGIEAEPRELVPDDDLHGGRLRGRTSRGEHEAQRQQERQERRRCWEAAASHDGRVSTCRG